MFKDDERYTNILGTPGSGPLELFWDIVDTMDQKLEGKIEIIEGAVRRYNEKHKLGDGMDVDGGAIAFKVGIETTAKAFLDVVKADEDKQVRALTDEELSAVFCAVSSSSFLSVAWCRSERFSGQLHEKVLKQAADEKRRAERKLRHLQDDLRYALKKLPEPLDVNLPYEDVRVYSGHVAFVTRLIIV